VVQGDGNFVIYGRDGRAVWATGTGGPVDRLLTGRGLAVGDALVSTAGDALLMQGDGNLVLYNRQNQPLWFSGTQGHPGATALMQFDGNLVVYSTGLRALWSTLTWTHPGSFALVTSSRLVVFDTSLSTTWASSGFKNPSNPPATPPISNVPCSSTPGSGDNVTRWTPVVLCVFGMLGVGGADNVTRVLTLIRNESGGNPRAINLWDRNATVLHDPSRGLIQVIGSTFAFYRSRLLANDIYDPAANIYAGLKYGIARYHSVSQIPLGGY
jgi:hypothetical protein